MIDGVGPGTVLAVRTENIFGEAIRFGSALVDRPNVENHIAVVHHVNPDKTIWGIEGRPGGVGWVDCSRYLNAVYTLSNRNQPMTTQQRQAICGTMESVLGMAYDWPAIYQDALIDLHLPNLWAEKWNNETPCHVVCSSLAAWAYNKNGLANPSEAGRTYTVDMRHVQPGDWTKFILANHYE